MPVDCVANHAVRTLDCAQFFMSDWLVRTEELQRSDLFHQAKRVGLFSKGENAMTKTTWSTILLIVLAVAASIALWGQVGQAQSGGVLTAEDRAEILDLYGRYAHALDGGDPEAYADTFTADGHVASNRGHDYRGRDQIKTAVPGGPGFGSGRHWTSNLKITPTVEGADGTIYLLLVNTSTQPPSVTGSGIYRDTLVRTAEGWKFKTKYAHLDGPSPTEQ